MIKAWMKWCLLLVPSLLTKPFTILTAWAVVPFANKDGYLEGWLSYWQTPDNSLDGDTGWQREHRPFKVERNKLHRYINRVGWLWRNSMYGFEIDVLGFDLDTAFHYRVKGNQKTSDNPYTPGWVYRTLETVDGRSAFQFYWIIPMPKGKCFRIMAGWKLWQGPVTGTKLQYAFSLNPFKSRGAM